MAYTVTYTKRYDANTVCSTFEEFITEREADDRLHEIMMDAEHVGTGVPFVGREPDTGHEEYVRVEHAASVVSRAVHGGFKE